MRRLWREVLATGGFAMIASASVSNAWAAVDADGPIEATTAQGDRVQLHSSGRREYVDARKAEAQRPVVDAYEKEKSLEQGGILGIGRKVRPGDADYNRGSMGSNSR